MSAIRLRFRSIRARLVTTTLLAFASTVVALALLCVAVADRAMRESIDGDLRRRGEDFALEIRQSGGHPREEDGPHGDGPPDSGGPRGDARPRNDAGRRHPNPDWVAPAHIVVGDEGRSGEPNSTPYDPRGYAVAARGATAFTTVQIDGEARRVFSAPVQRRGRVTDVVQVAYEMRQAEDSLDRLRLTILSTVVPLGMLFGGLASLLVVSRLTRPLRRLNDDALRIGRGGFSERLSPQGEDEFAALSHTLNAMVGDLEAVYRSEREANAALQASVERTRRFTGDASHEIKTPLAVLKANLGILKRSGRSVADEAASVQAMERATDRMNGLVQGLLLLARADDGSKRPSSPVRLDDELVDAVAGVPGSEGRVRLSLTPVTVLGRGDELVRVFGNLIENALKHSGASEPFEVALVARDGTAVVTVADHGVGIAPEHLPHLFERFYRVDRSRASATGGTGLGLAICESVVQGHGGTIAVESVFGEGTTFTVTLPQRSSEPFRTA